MINLKEIIKKNLIKKVEKELKKSSELNIDVHYNAHLYGGTYCASTENYKIEVCGTKCPTYYLEKQESGVGTSDYGWSEVQEIEIKKLHKVIEYILNDYILKQLTYEEYSSYNKEDIYWEDNHYLPATVHINGEKFYI